ncbi:GAF domain-containing protein [Streptomyces lividans 1326]|uniref:GAF domain-containing protein n=1 Tax=Streptomyces lividans 1326 TaxID=1200984 RepID=A0A7U9HCM6_STRLI|nr:GAF domain-containing protein [Streptomyces lividans 1326]
MSITSLCVAGGASHPCRAAFPRGTPPPRARETPVGRARSSTDFVTVPATASGKSNGVARGWRSLAFCRRAYFSSPPPREDGARSSVDRTPGSVAGFQVVPNHPRPSPSTYPSRPL